MRIAFFQILHVAGYPPLINLVESLKASGWDSSFGSLKDARSPLTLPPGVDAARAFEVCAGTGRLGRVVGRIRYAWRMVMTIRRSPPRLVVLTDPLATWLLPLIRVAVRCKVVYVEFDQPTWDLRRIMSRLLHRQAARHADLVMVPNEQRRRDFVATFRRSRPTITVMNLPRRAEVVAVPGPAVGDTLKVYYHGSLVRERVPETLLDAVARSPHVSLTIQGVSPVPDNGYREVLGRKIQALGLATRIKLLEPRPFESLASSAASHHVGLAFYDMNGLDPNLRSMWGATNKIFQYMAYGLAPLYSSDEPEMIRELETLGIRCAMHDAGDIARCFELLQRDAALLERLRQTGRARILAGWNFEAQMDAVVTPALKGLAEPFVRP